MKGYWNLPDATADGVVSERFPTETSEQAGDCFPRHRPGFNVVAAHIDNHALVGVRW
jgi:hypothetical protein